MCGEEGAHRRRLYGTAKRAENAHRSTKYDNIFDRRHVHRTSAYDSNINSPDPREGANEQAAVLSGDLHDDTITRLHAKCEGPAANAPRKGQHSIRPMRQRTGISQFFDNLADMGQPSRARLAIMSEETCNTPEKNTGKARFEACAEAERVNKVASRRAAA